MKPRSCKLIIVILFFLYAMAAAGKRDSTLWVGIKNAGIAFQMGEHDSVLVQARRLLDVASNSEDVLAQAQLHSLIGLCMDEKKNEKVAMQEYRQCVEIGEAHHFLKKAPKARHDLYFTMMLPAYARLALYYKNKDREESVGYARKGLEWVEQCGQPRLRMSGMSCFAEVLMASKDYMLIYEPMKRAVVDAIQLNQPDFALQMSAYLVQIERQVLHRDTADIPWIRAGRELILHAKTEQAKTLFLSAVNMPSKESAQEDKQQQEIVEKDTIAKEENAIPQPEPRIAYFQVRNQRIIYFVIFLGILLLIFLCYMLWQRHQRKKKERETKRLLKESYLEGLEQERSRLARELHDGVSNQLLAVEMKLNSDGLTEQTMQLLNESREQVRRFSHELMPPEFELATLDEILQDYCLKQDGVQSCQVIYEAVPEDADWSGLPHETAYEIYRIVQEALTNAMKHAKATIIKVCMRLDGEGLEVSVSDNGHVATEETAGGIGLRTMHQRAESIGATLVCTYAADGGKVVLKLTEF